MAVRKGMAKNDKNNTKNANEGIRYGPPTIVSIGIASLMEAFQVSEAAVQWVSTAYLLALAVAIPVVGWAEERFGGRRCWITGLVIFLIGSFLCAVSPGLPALVVCRVLQGFGAGALITLLTSLPVEIARNRGITEVGGIMSTVMLPLSLGPILGPVLGGIVLSAASWHWLFLINIPVGILAILFSARWLGADADGARTEKKRRFDLPGFLFVTGAISALLLGFTAVSQGDSLTAPSVAVPLILGIVMLAVFVALPSARDPERAIVDISLFRHRSVTAASAAMFFRGRHPVCGSVLISAILAAHDRSDRIGGGADASSPGGWSPAYPHCRRPPDRRVWRPRGGDRRFLRMCDQHGSISVPGGSNGLDSALCISFYPRSCYRYADCADHHICVSRSA